MQALHHVYVSQFSIIQTVSGYLQVGQSLDLTQTQMSAISSRVNISVLSIASNVSRSSSFSEEY